MGTGVASTQLSPTKVKTEVEKKREPAVTAASFSDAAFLVRNWKGRNWSSLTGD
jgi:hypothetical protein|tara:strand:+ start:165 stop:326 length:162 start_codon:yes stop_codon:yes gene_type:complete